MDFSKFFSSRLASKDVAKDRLKLILIHDRSDLSPELLELIKGEIMKVIANYCEVETSEVDIKLTRTDEAEGNSPALIASIPIRRLRGRETTR